VYKLNSFCIDILFLENDDYDEGLHIFGYALYTPLALPGANTINCNSKLKEVYSY
jgi:hypothetical protein